METPFLRPLSYIVYIELEFSLALLPIDVSSCHRIDQQFVRLWQKKGGNIDERSIEFVRSDHQESDLNLIYSKRAIEFRVE